MKEQKASSGNKNGRRATPKQIEVDVLVRSRRRCCLCACLENDFTVKSVQIAHIDHNPSNTKPDNLVPLCVRHHEDYDTKKSQTKGITDGEIKHYRAELDKVLQQTDEQIQVNIVGIGRNEDSSDQLSARPSARLLGEVLQAFDEEILRIRPGNELIGHPTGIKLSRLGQRAVIEEGDLEVALEAFMSLLRLSNTFPGNYSGRLDTSLFPRLIPELSTMKLLPIMQQDWMLIFEAVRRAKIYALIGDAQVTELSNYSEIPNDSWKTVVDIFYHYTKFGNDLSREEGWRGGHIMMCLAELLVGLGIVYTSRGLKLPDAPQEIRMTTSDERGMEPGQPVEIFPYIYLANKIAMLSKDDFEFALGQVEHYRHPVTQVIVDPNNYMLFTLEEAKKEILSWAIRPGSESTFVAVSSEESKNICLQLLQELQETGQKVSDNTKAFLIGERSCAVNQCYFREGCSFSYGYNINIETDDVTFEP